MGSEQYARYFEVEAVGQRIGLMACLRCGATILIGDADIDAVATHDSWHRDLEILLATD